ncbi:MAG: hypothetical protein JXR68_10915 [Bacteroidales bacterium]|nr:hypothetical protein [Bacteroidales bacterium]
MEINFKNNLVQNFNDEKLVLFVNKNNENFTFAMKIALADEQPYAWRATWVINHATKNNDPRLTEYIYLITKDLQKKQDGHQRELLKLIEKIKIAEENEGLIFDICMTIWEDVDKIPSVRIIALKMLVKIVKKYPELMNELKFITQEHYTETLSPGIKNSMKKMMKNL